MTPAICLHSQPIEIRDPGSLARAIRFSGAWMFSLGANCLFDRQQIQTDVLGCTANNTCGKPLDAAAVSALNKTLSQAQMSRMMLNGRQLDVIRVADGMMFGFDSAEGLLGALPGLGPVPQGPGPGGRPPPTGGGGGSGGTGGPDIPCCPGCGRCLPSDCPDPPPVVPRFFDDGCDARVCVESLPPGTVCECFDTHCHPG